MLTSTSEQLAIQPAGGLPADRDAAIQQYMPLVRHVVRRISTRLPEVLDYEDLVSYGMIGLIQAIDRYDDSKGVKFESYAPSRIRGAIVDALRSLDAMPRSVRQKAKDREKVATELTSQLGREPTDQEMARGMGLTTRQYRKALVDSSWVTVSLDRRATGFDGNDTLGDIIPDPDQEDLGADIEKAELLESLAAAIEALPEREGLIVSLYYKENLSMKEVAEVLDVSESRVCQLHRRALDRLRTQLSSRAAA